MSTDQLKIEVVRKWPKPASVRRLLGLLGFTGYYLKFVKDYGTISKPFTTLLKKDSFIWSMEVEHAFETLNVAMTSALVLALPNMSELL